MRTGKRNTKTTKADSQTKEAKEQGTALLSDILPLPDPRFRGRIGNTYVDSEADVISLPAAPAGAPNVLLVLLDDVTGRQMDGRVRDHADLGLEPPFVRLRRIPLAEVA